VLKLANEKRLMKGRKVGVDTTTVEADAAMNSILRVTRGRKSVAASRRSRQRG